MDSPPPSDPLNASEITASAEATFAWGLVDVFDHVTDWLMLVDTDHVIRRVNRAMAEGLGSTPSALVGKACHVVMYGSDHPGRTCAYDHLPSDDDARSGVRFDIPGHGLFDCSCTPLRGADGTVVGAVHVARDVNASAATEEALSEQMHFLRQLLDTIPAPVFQKDADGVYRDCNEAFLAFLGLTRDEVVGKTVHDIAHPDWAEVYEAKDRALLGSQEVQSFESVVRNSAGERRDVLLTKATYSGLDGAAAGIVGIIFDITQRRRAEDALRQSEARLERAQRVSRMGSWEWDIAGERLAWSGEAYSIFGVDRSFALTFDGIAGLIHPDDREHNARMVSELLKSGGGEFQLRLVTPGGEVRHIHQTMEVTHDESGAAVAAFGTVLDITDRVRREELKREREALLRGLFETMTSGCAIYQVRNDGRSGSDYIVKDFNPAALRIEGMTRDEVVGRSLRDLRPAIDEYGLIDVFRQVWQTGEPAFLPAKNYTDQTYANWYENRVFRLPTCEIVAIYDDVTERVRAEEALRMGEERLRETFDDTITAIGSIVALRDPYTAGHERRVLELANAVAEEMDVSGDVAEGLRLAAEIHDIGKVAVPAEILAKPAGLNPWEFSLVKQHATVGHEILSKIAFEQPVAEIVHQHHERLDGSGYPRGISGDAMMLESRILAVADVVEAMASHRPYRPALGIDAALAEVREHAESLFDADVVTACERVIASGAVDLASSANAF
jgi:PAS domain S-box-containing protein/putative nucleotidyltransferase with HDIG domain